MENPTKEQLIQKYREMGQQYESASNSLPEPVKSTYLRIAKELYQSANKLDGGKDEWQI